MYFYLNFLKNVSKHMARFHSSKKPFKCQECNQAFATKYELDRHTLTHKRPMPKLNIPKTHVCKQCGKGFYHMSHLR